MHSPSSVPTIRLSEHELGPLRPRLLRWVAMQSHALWLDNCGSHVDAHGEFEWLAGIQLGEGPRAKSWEELCEQVGQSGEGRWAWWFGGLSYELGETFHPGLALPREPQPAFSPAGFFQADVLVWRRRGEDDCWLQTADPEAVKKIIKAVPLRVNEEDAVLSEAFRSAMDGSAYEAAVRRVQDWIREGDVYEVNVSQEFRAKAATNVPLAALFERLTARSPMPFSALFRWGETSLLCASPERFLRANGAGQLVAQPIKGTIRRGGTPEEDQALAAALQGSEKERAENVMIADLLRNDLNRVCLPGSVQVSALCECQTFAGLHHLVTTVQGELAPARTALDAVAAAFPPGSMTGAPKRRAMEVIGELEGRPRGLYAGSLGYFGPGGQMDLNVAIRSLRCEGRSLSYRVGGAVTIDSGPAAEREEAILKASALARVFEAHPQRKSPAGRPGSG